MVAVTHNAACIVREQTSKGSPRPYVGIAPDDASRRPVDRVVGHAVERFPKGRHRLLALRNARFFSLAELNVAIRILVDELDARLMRKFVLSV